MLGCSLLVCRPREPLATFPYPEERTCWFYPIPAPYSLSDRGFILPIDKKVGGAIMGIEQVNDQLTEGGDVYVGHEVP